MQSAPAQDELAQSLDAWSSVDDWAESDFNRWEQYAYVLLLRRLRELGIRCLADLRDLAARMAAEHRPLHEVISTDTRFALTQRVWLMNLAFYGTRRWLLPPNAPEALRQVAAQERERKCEVAAEKKREKSRAARAKKKESARVQAFHDRPRKPLPFSRFEPLVAPRREQQASGCSVPEDRLTTGSSVRRMNAEEDAYVTRTNPRWLVRTRRPLRFDDNGRRG